jgi:hypothetical protein
MSCGSGSSAGVGCGPGERPSRCPRRQPSEQGADPSPGATTSTIEQLFEPTDRAGPGGCASRCGEPGQAEKRAGASDGGDPGHRARVLGGWRGGVACGEGGALDEHARDGDVARRPEGVHVGAVRVVARDGCGADCDMVRAARSVMRHLYPALSRAAGVSPARARWRSTYSRSASTGTLRRRPTWMAWISPVEISS